MKGSKKVRGNSYEEKSEKMEGDRIKKDARSGRKTAGMETLLKKSQKHEGYGKLPKVKPNKKGKGFIK